MLEQEGMQDATLFAETYTNNDYIVKQIDGNPYSDKQVRDRVKKIMKIS